MEVASRLFHLKVILPLWKVDCMEFTCSSLFFCFPFSPVPDYLKETVETIMKIHKTQPSGDVLAFVTGQDEVEQVLRLVM